MRIVLASGSPRRRELLTQIGLNYEVMISAAKEDSTATNPGKYVEELSKIKSDAVAEMLKADAAEDIAIIGADTVVVFDGTILGKPGNKKDAVSMLEQLQGRSHEVYTGVTVDILHAPINGDLPSVTKSVSFHEKTTVHFAEMTEAEIYYYVNNGEPMDKAGAYGIQGLGARYITGIEGDYNNVVGLPVGRLYRTLCEMDII